METTTMQVITRSGISEPFKFDKIADRLSGLSDGLKVDPVLIVQQTANRIKNGITTQELD